MLEKKIGREWIPVVFEYLLYYMVNNVVLKHVYSGLFLNVAVSVFIVCILQMVRFILNCIDNTICI